MIHDRSAVAEAVLSGRVGVCDCVDMYFEGDGVGVDCLRGEPCGVAARTVGDRPTGDSGLRNGDARGELKESGCFMGVGGFDYVRISKARDRSHDTANLPSWRVMRVVQRVFA